MYLSCFGIGIFPSIERNVCVQCLRIWLDEYEYVSGEKTGDRADMKVPYLFYDDDILDVTAGLEE